MYKETGDRFQSFDLILVDVESVICQFVLTPAMTAILAFVDRGHP